MKKWFFVIIGFTLAACGTTSEIKDKSIALTPPAKTEKGFIRLSPKSQYYVDTASIWADNEKKNLINFDTVINLHRGHHVYPDAPDKLSRSIRQHKVLDCDTFRLTHVDSHIYSDFWGQGLTVEPKSQADRSVVLREGSSLGTIGQIICANYYRN